MKIKSILGSFFLLAGMAFGQQFSGGGSGVKATGAITAGHCVNWVDATHIQDAGGTCGTGTNAAFNAITGGTNTTAAMVIGTGGSLTVSGTGTINATTLGGATFAAPGTIGGGTPGAATFTTISSTTINGAAFSGTFTGAPTFSGNIAFTGTPTFSNTLALNTTGNALTATTAGNLSGTPALPNGTTATTQTALDSTQKLATTAFVSTNPLNNVANPTAVKSFTMGANTLNFNMTADWGAGFGISITSNGGNTATGPLFQLSTGTTTSHDVFQACAKGTSNCIKFDQNALFSTTGTGLIDASKLSGTIPTGVAAVTQSVGNNSTLLATTAFVIANAGVGTITGITTAAGSGLSGGATSGAPSLTLLTTCSPNQVLAWSGTAWACAAAGTGTVTSVTGTATQLSCTAGATPVCSITSPFNPPGDVQLTSSNVLSWLTASIGLSADATTGVLDVGNGTLGDTSGIIQANGFVGKGVNAGAVILPNGNGTCPTPASGNLIMCPFGSSGNAYFSENGNAFARIVLAGNLPFDTGGSGLAQPTSTADASFTFGATHKLALAGTAPASTSSTGTDAGTIFSATGATGGATTGNTTTAGVGGGVILAGGDGGSAAGATNGQGGQGGGFHWTSGAAGLSSGTGLNANAGDFEVTVKEGGTGGTGTSRRGRMILDQLITNAIADSPKFEWRATYEVTGGPTFGIDSWTANIVEQAATINGNTTLTYAQSGSTGTAAVSIPTLILGKNGASNIAGTISINNATSGTILITPPTGALGSVTLTLPDVTGTFAGTTGALTSGNCSKFNAFGQIIDAGNPCGTAIGTINSGTTNQITVYSASTSLSAAADFTITTHTFASGVSGIVDLSAGPVLTGLKIPSAAGAAPTADGQDAFNTTLHARVHGSNGTTIVEAAAATGTTAATTCSNQFVSAVSSIAAPTCTTATLASAQFANQGTTTTLLHGNGAGNPAFGAVVTNDLGANAVTSAKMYSGAGSRSLGWSFGDVATGSALTTSEVGYITIPHNFATCTISGWHIMADAGTVTIKTARVATGGTALPTIGSNSISTSGVALSSGTLVNSTTVTDFTSTTLSAGDTLGFFITTVATAKQITFSIDCDQ